MFSKRLCDLVLVTITAILASSCTTELCTRHSDCPPSSVCGAVGVCVMAPLNGVADASLADASPADASPADASLADASLADASLADASLADASLADASLADAGGSVPDAGLVPPADASPVPQPATAFDPLRSNIDTWRVQQ